MRDAAGKRAIVFNLHDTGTQNQSAPDTAFNRSAETAFGNQPFPPNFAAASSARPKKNGKKYFLIFGGVLSLFGLLAVAGALIVYFNMKSNKAVVVNPTPSLRRRAASPINHLSRSLPLLQRFAFRVTDRRAECDSAGILYAARRADQKRHVYDLRQRRLAIVGH
jgi:hypothetical protein